MFLRHGYILVIKVLECRSDHDMLNDFVHKAGQDEYWWDNL